MNDIAEEIARDCPNDGLKWDTLAWTLLLYADDILAASTTADGLQRCLDSLKTYADKWSLVVNIDKTKVLVFRRGNRAVTEKFYYDGAKLETVDEFVYLGLNLSSNGKWRRAKNRCMAQAEKATFLLEKRLHSFNFDISTKANLYQRFVQPVLLIGSELWGLEDCKDVDRVPLGFYKKQLHLKPSTSTDMLLTELGIPPLEHFRKCRAIGYWATLVDTSTPERLAKKAYQTVITSGGNSWTRAIKKSLEELGLGIFWTTQQIGSKKPFMSMIKEASSKKYMSEMYARCVESPKSKFFRDVAAWKPPREANWYINNITNAHAVQLCRFRLRNSYIREETGSWDDVPEHERKCPFCHCKDDEQHHVLECIAYVNLRGQYISPDFWIQPSYQKLIDLFNSDDRKTLQDLAIFLKKAGDHRKLKYLEERAAVLRARNQINLDATVLDNG